MRAPRNEEASGGDFVRAPGLLVIAAIVLVGIASGAGYFHYKAPQVWAEQEARLAASPTTAEGRLAAWFEIGAAQIHHRLSKIPPRVGDRTWIVTHAVLDPAGGVPEIWGIDTTELPLTVSRIEGLTVVLELPAPVALGRAALHEEAVRNVPRYAAGAPVPDPSARLEEVVRWFLAGLPAALERDIPGARLEIRIGGDPRPEAGEAPQLGPDEGR